VKFCAGTGGDSDYYVYQLKNVPVCDMAYCAVKGMPTGMHFNELHPLDGQIASSLKPRHNALYSAL